jgi:phage-related protein
MIRKNQEFIAHQGPKYTLEWYFDAQGKSIALDYFEKMPRARQKKFDYFLHLMGLMGKILDITKFRHEGDGIYVFKPQPDRFFCFFVQGEKIIITNAYEKKTDKMSTTDYAKAQKLRSDYITRYEKGTYYENSNS